MRALAAELRKLSSLPSLWAGVVTTVVGMAALAWLNTVRVRSDPAVGADVLSASPFGIAFAGAPLGTVGAVIIGVVAFSSEYAVSDVEAGGSRQISTSLLAVPRRLVMLITKAAAVAVAVVFTALLAFPISLLIARAVLGDAGGEHVSARDIVMRCSAALLYWGLSGLMALAVTVMTRSGTIPLIVLIVNNSLVSVSFLLTRVTHAANWLPDMAGRALFSDLAEPTDGALEATPGALVMAGWTIGLLLVAAAVAHRRDA